MIDKVQAMSTSDVLAPWQGQPLVPLPDLGAAVGLDRARQSYAIEKGIIRPVPKRGPNGRYMVTWDEAVLIAAAAILAVTAGVALVTMIRSLRGAGAQIGSNGITIPIGAL
jgi:hypothetical protein